MFVIDSLLMVHGKSAFVLFKALARKAQEEWLGNESVKQEVQELSRDKWGEEGSDVAAESDLPPALPPAQDSEPDL